MLETKQGSQADSLNIVVLFALLISVALNIKVLMYQVDLSKKVANKETGKFLGLIEYDYLVYTDTVHECTYTDRFFKHNNAVTAALLDMEQFRRDTNVINLRYEIIED